MKTFSLLSLSLYLSSLTPSLFQHVLLQQIESGHIERESKNKRYQHEFCPKPILKMMKEIYVFFPSSSCCALHVSAILIWWLCETEENAKDKANCAAQGKNLWRVATAKMLLCNSHQIIQTTFIIIVSTAFVAFRRFILCCALDEFALANGVQCRLNEDKHLLAKMYSHQNYLVLFDN